MSQNEYITSDIHFSHKRIMDFCPNTRPYSSVEERNEALIEAWNTTVQRGDIIWHLGDFSFGSKDSCESILKRLNGQKHFILGNHDGGVSHILKKYGWVGHYKELKRFDYKVCLFHFPMREWHQVHRGSLHFYGHCHGTLKGRGRSMDVGWDAHGRILSMEEAVNMVKDIPIFLENGMHGTER